MILIFLQHDSDAHEAMDETSDDVTIAGRTRTKLSLTNVDISELELFLQDDEPLEVPRSSSHFPPPQERLSAEDLEYQRFLASLVPTPSTPSVMTESEGEDEEYSMELTEGEEEEEETLDQETSISKKELEKLLHAAVAPSVAIPSLLGDRTIIRFDGHRHNGGGEISGIPPSPFSNPRTILPNTSNRVLSNPNTNSMLHRMRLQVASQIHQHFQLLRQALYLLDQGGSTTEESLRIRTEYTQMLEEIQRRKDHIATYRREESKFSGPMVLDSRTSVGYHTRSVTEAESLKQNPSVFYIQGLEDTDVISRWVHHPSGSSSTTHFEEFPLDVHLIGPGLGCHTNHNSLNFIPPKPGVPKPGVLTKKSKSTKYPAFTRSEHQLLCHGVHMFGNGSSRDNGQWIIRHFLPQKNLCEIRNASIVDRNLIQAYLLKQQRLSSYVSCRNLTWIPDEDRRICRGLFQFHTHRQPFRLIAQRYLPHRSANEVRKRWERLRPTFGYVRETKLLNIPKMEAFLASPVTPRSTSSKKEDDAIPSLTIEDKENGCCSFGQLHRGVVHNPMLRERYTNLMYPMTCRHHWPCVLHDTPLSSSWPSSPVQDFDVNDDDEVVHPCSEEDSEFEQDELLSSSSEDESAHEFEQDHFFNDSSSSSEEEEEEPLPTKRRRIEPTLVVVVWTKEQDKMILSHVQQYGVTSETWHRLTTSLHPIAQAAIESRYRFLIQTIQRPRR